MWKTFLKEKTYLVRSAHKSIVSIIPLSLCLYKSASLKLASLRDDLRPLLTGARFGIFHLPRRKGEEDAFASLPIKEFCLCRLRLSTQTFSVCISAPLSLLKRIEDNSLKRDPSIVERCQRKLF